MLFKLKVFTFFSITINKSNLFWKNNLTQSYMSKFLMTQFIFIITIVYDVQLYMMYNYNHDLH